MAASLLCGCEVDPPYGTQPISLDTFLERNAPATQTFSFDAAAPQSVKNGNATVHFPEGAFVNAAGDVVNSGVVELEFKTVFTPKEMILANISTLSDGRLLMSGGQVWLRATQDGQLLGLNQNKTTSLDFATNGDGEPMQLFYGVEFIMDNGDVLFHDWALGDSAIVTPTWNTGTAMSELGFYRFNISSLTWINCDYFVADTSELVPVQVLLPDSFDHFNTSVNLVFPDLNAVTGLDVINDTFSTWNYSVPVNLPAVVVVISVVNDQYYSSVESIQITKDHPVVLVPTPTTEADLLESLEHL